MDVFRIIGGARLNGEVRVAGAKNSVLKLMALSLLAEGRSVITDVPDILDVQVMSELLGRLGCHVNWDRPGGRLEIDVPAELERRADYDLVRQMRASVSVLGPLVARLGVADIALPGGDEIGSRGLDMHMAGLERMGAKVISEHGYLLASAPSRLEGAVIWLDFPSVGATETLLMASATASGTTVIDNAAREPEVADIAHALVEMGAVIDGIGTSTLEVHGVDGLTPVSHRTVPDRIVAGTWAVAAAITGGDITVRNARPEHMGIVLDKLTSTGAEVSVTGDGIRVVMENRPKAVDIVTLPYPGFPTDLQPQFIALNSMADGMAMVTENLFESRFKFVNELVRLGADVRIEGHHALVRGHEALSGAPVEATDIRAGASLVLAGLVAQGETVVHHVHHIDRGYASFVPDLVSLGARIERCELPHGVFGPENLDPTAPSS
ncbi:MAG: UDP-N-acetylglucosamine 1-carboxyvinyltransferase [Candidatus Nanopelagicales bacterium]|nr:UDP-N-acetylglucosamine 1-carboxyvinyltransferase [Candidatus Nanopelagicales bacterium]MDZ4249248.1 UDP-N-acetylglucosamine 1-carboxyvinyltransferase [Candidatus Nanopelagicales bacterium]